MTRGIIGRALRVFSFSVRACLAKDFSTPPSCQCDPFFGGESIWHGQSLSVFPLATS